ncbi:hypothetical protein EC988_003541, partial [Linderina pennispora]
MRLFRFRARAGSEQSSNASEKHGYFSENDAYIIDTAGSDSTFSVALLHPQKVLESQAYELALILAGQYVRESEELWVGDPLHDPSATMRAVFPDSFPPTGTCSLSAAVSFLGPWLGSAGSCSSLSLDNSGLKWPGNRNLAMFGRSKIAGRRQTAFSNDDGSTVCGSSHLCAVPRINPLSKADRLFSRPAQWVRRLV